MNDENTFNYYFKDIFYKRCNKYQKNAITIHFLAADIIFRFYLWDHVDLSLWFTFDKIPKFPDSQWNFLIFSWFLKIFFFSWPFPYPWESWCVVRALVIRTAWLHTWGLTQERNPTSVMCVVRGLHGNYHRTGSVIKMLKALGWTNLADRRKDLRLALLFFLFFLYNKDPEDFFIFQ